VGRGEDGRGVGGLKCLRAELNSTYGLSDARQTPILCGAPGSRGAQQRSHHVAMLFSIYIYLNLIIRVNKLKLSNRSEKLP
jgi:hypothetical protein